MINCEILPTSAGCDGGFLEVLLAVPHPLQACTLECGIVHRHRCRSSNLPQLGLHHQSLQSMHFGRRLWNRRRLILLENLQRFQSLCPSMLAATVETAKCARALTRNCSQSIICLLTGGTCDDFLARSNVARMASDPSIPSIAANALSNLSTRSPAAEIFVAGSHPRLTRRLLGLIGTKLGHLLA